MSVSPPNPPRMSTTLENPAANRSSAAFSERPPIWQPVITFASLPKLASDQFYKPGIQLHAPAGIRFQNRNVLRARDMPGIELLHGTNVQVNIACLRIEELLGLLRRYSIDLHNVSFLRVSLCLCILEVFVFQL